MKEYPEKIYISATWKGDTDVLDQRVAGLLMRQGVTVVQDVEANRDDPPSKLDHWVHRIEQYMRDCCGLAVVFPNDKRDKKTLQTTSPYMFPEVLAAAKRCLPILVFSHDRVEIQREKTSTGIEISFGSGAGQHLRPDDFFGDQMPGKDAVDELLEAASVLQLPANTDIALHRFSDRKNETERLIEDFVEKAKRGSNPDRPYVMNILPFVDQESVHPATAKAVFQSTGLECRISLDSQGGNTAQREEWKKCLSGAEFYVAELTRLRDNCLYEVGIGQGLEKDVLIVCRRELDTLPFGLDNSPFICTYKRPSELGKVVKEGCENLFRRKVHNLDPVYRKEFPDGVPGLPAWLEEKHGHGMGWKLNAAVVSFSVSAGLLLMSAFLFFSELDFSSIGLSLIPMTLGFFGNNRSIREWIERKLKDQLPWIPKLALIILTMSVIAFGAGLLA